MTTRRALVASLGASMALRVAPGVAQPARSRPRIGIVHPASVQESAIYKILVSGLAQLGYVTRRPAPHSIFRCRARSCCADEVIR